MAEAVNIKHHPLIRWGKSYTTMRRLVILFALTFVGCTQSDQWTAFVFPDIENIPGPEKSEKYIVGSFRSFEECQAAAFEKVRARVSTSQKEGAYVCGLNCSNRRDLGNLLVCEEKRK
jgi:hypothetical protein